MSAARPAVGGALVAALLSLAIAACPSPPSPAPMPPDATDGAVYVVPDGSPLGLQCAAACQVLKALGCPTETDCVTVYAHFESGEVKRTPSGALLTCDMVVKAKSKADIVGLGIGCP